MNNPNKGKNTIINRGSDKKMTVNVEIILNADAEIKYKLVGNSDSIMLVSLVNLLSIRPIGIDSKKFKFFLNIDESIES